MTSIAAATKHTASLSRSTSNCRSSPKRSFRVWVRDEEAVYRPPENTDQLVDGNRAGCGGDLQELGHESLYAMDTSLVRAEHTVVGQAQCLGKRCRVAGRAGVVDDSEDPVGASGS